MAQDFHDQLIHFLPKMRVWALALTRNRAAAEDLMQDVATKALVAKDCFTPGTNFSAWVHRPGHHLGRASASRSRQMIPRVFAEYLTVPCLRTPQKEHKVDALLSSRQGD